MNAHIFNSVEINSSFYRDHKRETYARWRVSTPDNFLFSVKLSRYFTQEKRLTEAGNRLKNTLDGIAHLKEKWGVLLVQLPPSLNFKLDVAEYFMSEIRNYYSGSVWVGAPKFQLD